MAAILLLLAFLVWSLYSLFSFSLTAPNLFFTYWPPYVAFQNFIWSTVTVDSVFQSKIYAGLIAAACSIYVALIGVLWLRRTKPDLQLSTVHSPLSLLNSKVWRRTLLFGMLSFLPLTIANTALSYDVFNYMFNAKMVVEYQLDPHVVSAKTVLNDPWIRFMHNIDTPAPYGYIWTYISVGLYWLGDGKFLPIWLLFRIMSMASYAWLLYAVITIQSKRSISPTFPLWKIALLALNPLLLIEIIATSHNDLWMMAPAISSLGLLLPHSYTPTKKSRWSAAFFSLAIISAGLLSFSISLKLATVVLVPIWAMLIFARVNSRIFLSELITEFWPLATSVLMFLPLLSIRSQQFHPWYLTWSLSFISLIPVSLSELRSPHKPLYHAGIVLGRIWVSLLIVMSAASLLRYVPYLRVGSYVTGVLVERIWITWIPFLIALVLFGTIYSVDAAIRGSKTPTENHS